ECNSSYHHLIPESLCWWLDWALSVHTDNSPKVHGIMVGSRGGLTTHGAPRTIGDHGAPVSLPKLKKAYEKGTRGISWGPLLTPGPRAVPEFPNGQSAPGQVPLQ
ncbi:unnamed protein product, partial [Staurois parvus]